MDNFEFEFLHQKSYYINIVSIISPCKKLLWVSTYLEEPLYLHVPLWCLLELFEAAVAVHELVVVLGKAV